MKKSREEIAYEYLKEAGPALISFKQPMESTTQILLSGHGDAFWLNEETGPDTPWITLQEVLEEAKHLLLIMFTAEMDTDLTADKLFKFEGELRSVLKKTQLKPEEVRDLKIKFLDLKEEVLEK